MTDKHRRQMVEAILKSLTAAFPGWACDEWEWSDLSCHVFAARTRGAEHRLVVHLDFLDDHQEDEVLARLIQSKALERMRERSDKGLYVNDSGLTRWTQWTQHPES